MLLKKGNSFEMNKRENMALSKTTWRHIRRSPYQAFAAIFIILQTFFVISVFTFVIVGSAKIIDYFESLPQVTAFFKSETKTEEIQAIENQLKQSGKVESVKFVSKEKALQIYQQKFKDDPLLLEFVTADILPASLEIATNEIDDLATISEELRKSPHVQEVVFPKDVVTNIAAWTDALRKIGIGLIAVLLLDSVFLMVIIIGIKISQRRDEIEIMRLLGATNWYIRWPFILEGILYGVVGAFFAWLLSSAALWYMTPLLMSFLQGIPVTPFDPIFLLGLLGVELVFAVVLGAFSSFLAVLRYLK